MTLAPELRAALLSDINTPASPEAERLTRRIVDVFGPATSAVLHYGSHAQTSGAADPAAGKAGNVRGAYDFFVTVSDYARAHRSFVEHTGARFNPRIAAAIGRVLPPNMVALTLRDDGETLQAKCGLLTPRALRFLCSPYAHDHFTRGRLFQEVKLLWWRTPPDRVVVEEALLAARFGTFGWVRPYLPASFDAEEYCRTLLSVSYRGEIRPERQDRSAQVFAAQRGALVPLYDALLQYLTAQGVLRCRDGRYSLSRPVSAWTRANTKQYFRRSKTRATLRWGKHLWLYDDWLAYIQQKVERHTGEAVELTPRERRWPLVFLWPKAIRFLRSRR